MCFFFIQNLVVCLNLNDSDIFMRHIFLDKFSLVHLPFVSKILFNLSYYSQ